MLSEMEAGGFSRWVRREWVKFTTEMIMDLHVRIEQLEVRKLK